MNIRLIISEDGTTREFPIDDHQQMTIGRDANNDIVIKNQAVSRSHAMIRKVATGHYTVSDLGSANGTFLNNRRVTSPAMLADGDRIKMGETEICFSNPLFTAEDSIEDGSESTINVVHDILTTVFVADVRGFTRLSERLTPRVLSDVINAWCKRAQEVIDRYGGHVDKFIGDAVMASWNHTNEGRIAEDIQSALWAAVDLNKETSNLSNEFTIDLPFPLKIGVGLNTGYVMLGNVGKDARRDFTMLGDTVNMAFRYETYTKKEGTDVNIGELTMKQLGVCDDLFRTIDIELPGRNQAERVHGISIYDLELHLMKNIPAM